MTAHDDEWVAPVVSLFGSDRRRPTGREPEAPADATRTDRESVVDRATDRRAAALAALQSAEQESTPAAEPAAPADKAARRAQNVSVAALTRRGMSEAELRDRLRDREIADDQIDAEVERLRASHYLDDVALAENVVRTESERKGRGRSAIAAELRRRRIDQGAIDAALENIDEDDERERAREVAERRVRQMPGQPPEVLRRRLTGFLQRRGYSGPVLQYALSSALRSGSTDRVRFVDADELGDDDED